jgi:uncharacterized protein YqeY
MTLKDTIAHDMKEAMKAGNKLELETLRSIRAGILEYEKKQAGYEVTPDDELSLLNSAAKKRKEAIEQYNQAGRDDLADHERQELSIIQRYLPEQLSEDEIRELARKAAAEAGISDMGGFGKVMGPLMKELKGKADGAVVQRILKELLGGA